MSTQCTRSRPPLQLEFPRVGRRRLVARVDGGTITSNAGVLLLRAVEHGSHLCRRAAACFRDYRDPRVIEHTVADLVTQRVLAVALGYEDLNDHDTLRRDPLVAAAVGKADPTGAQRVRSSDRGAALAGKSTLNRLELVGSTDAATDRYKKVTYDAAALDALLVDVFLEAHPTPPARIVLDVDATDDPVHGQQEGRFFHGYYRHYCYLPLYIFCGPHVLYARLRPSNIDGAAGVVDEVARIVGQVRQAWPTVSIVVRGTRGSAATTCCTGAKRRRWTTSSAWRRTRGCRPGSHPNWRRPRRNARPPGPPRGCVRTSAIARARAGAGSAAWSPRRSICPRAPIPASW